MGSKRRRFEADAIPRYVSQDVDISVTVSELLRVASAATAASEASEPSKASAPGKARGLRRDTRARTQRRLYIAIVALAIAVIICAVLILAIMVRRGHGLRTTQSMTGQEGRILLIQEDKAQVCPPLRAQFRRTHAARGEGGNDGHLKSRIRVSEDV